MDTTSHPAVIPTSPASIPLHTRDSDGFPNMSQVTNSVASPPVAAAILVVQNTLEIALASSGVLAASWEPGLKPNHPNQRMNTPSAPSARL